MLALSETLPGRGRADLDWARRFRQALLGDLPIHLVIGVYFASAGLLTLAFGRVHPAALGLSYLDAWGSIALWLLASLLCLRVGVRIARNPSGAPLRQAESILAQELSPERISGLLLFLAMAVFMGAFTATKCMLPLIIPFWFDPALAAADQALHFGVDPWRWLHPLLGRADATRWIEIAYLPVWIPFTTGMLLCFCVLVRDQALRRRFLIAYLMGWIVNGTAVACLFMSGGPAFYDDLVGDPARFGDLTRYLAFDVASPISAAAEQHLLWSERANVDAAIAGGISAFPSLHVTMAVLCALACWRLNRMMGLLATLFAGVIAIGSIHLGWHYAVGDYYAISSTCGFWWVAGRMASSSAPRQPRRLAFPATSA